MIAGAMFGGAAWVAPSAYFMGIAAIICSGIILKKTKMFAGDPGSLRYGAARLPHARLWATSSAACGSAAGPLSRRPAPSSCCPPSLSGSLQLFGFVDGRSPCWLRISWIRASWRPSAARSAWIFAPLGWGNWQAAVASITGLIAKENIVGTLGYPVQRRY